MITVYKYPIEVGEQLITMPLGAQILSADEQGGTLCLWALVDTELQPTQRSITVVGTGQRLAGLVTNEGLGELAECHIGTVQDGLLVWHIFDTTIFYIKGLHQ